MTHFNFMKRKNAFKILQKISNIFIKNKKYILTKDYYIPYDGVQGDHILNWLTLYVAEYTLLIILHKSVEWSAFALVYSEVNSKAVKLSETNLGMVVLIFNTFSNSISFLGSYVPYYIYMVLLF